MSVWGLVTPFLTDDFMFACGVEFGFLYDRMKKRPKNIKEYVQVENQDRILVMAHRVGYNVVKMEPWQDSWLYIHLRRRK